MGDAFIGEVRLFGGDYAPDGWLPCDGRTLSISEYSTLYTLIGTTYGGDGRSTFALPDLRGRLPVGQGATYALGQTGGAEAVTLSAVQTPVHAHPVQAVVAAGTSGDPTNGIWADAVARSYSTVTPDTTMHPSSLSQSGGSQPHGNMMPFFVLNFIICYNGLFPTRP
jgi:microcystin-dependent protein